VSKIESENLSPMMQQYRRIKQENPDALLFFRLGDFYELFGEDAKEASGLLDITLTARSSGEGRANKIPMCGVPYHAAEGYIAKLLKAGRKVAVVEQVEDPRKAKGMVKRELVRIITPGTILEANSLDAKQNNYLAAIALGAVGIGLAAVDLSTGEFLVTEFRSAETLDGLFIELNRLRPAELLIPDDLAESLRRRLAALEFTYVTQQPGFRFDAEAGRIQLLEHFRISSLDQFGCGELEPGLGAAAAALHYLLETQRGTLVHIRSLTPYTLQSHMILDQATVRNLELVRNSADGSRRNTLLHVLDFTHTAMGGRRLYQWILRPLLNLKEIHARQAAVTELQLSLQLRRNLTEILKSFHDLERLAGRVGSSAAHARDLVALGSSLTHIPALKTALLGTHSEILTRMASGMPECQTVQRLLAHALMAEPPLSIKEGGIIRLGYHPEVDELRSLAKTGKSFIADLQVRERERTGIGSLKVEYNSVFGYYIEVSKANSKLVPEDYQRKQTLVNAERYITPELKEYEQKVLGAEEKLMVLELELFLKIRELVAAELSGILKAADMIADLDVLVSLAESASRNNFCRPHMDESGILRIRGNRHPVVEQLTASPFVPNDVYLDNANQQIMVLTGPNMAGKSTYLRQLALAVIMAQIGGFVPAAEAQIGLVDRVFTRVGASDNLAAGQSTFMVEMTETANILKNATTRSLVILDEVGRGTSTFDGVSIAWAVVEYLHDTVGAKTLFATHYYEITELALSKARVKNFNIAVREWKEDIIFLRKIIEGSADRSYGIQVARLAGLPAAVIERSREVLTNLERANYTDSGNSRLALHMGEIPGEQPSLFEDPRGPELLEQIQRLDIDRMMPLDALNALSEWKKKYS
jgi:DNA mismatch repair protein MutS